MNMALSSKQIGSDTRDAPHGHGPFSSELNDLAARLATMGGLAESQLARAIDALESRDIEAAEYVVGNDAAIDDAETDINARAMKMLTLYAPVAGDLREIVAALKISTNVERIGDYSVNIAKRSVIINGTPQISTVGGVIELGRLVQRFVQNAFDAYAERSLSRADAVWRGDSEIDALHSSVFQELLSDMLVDSDQVLTCTHLMFVIKNLERIGDHAANIAETIQFLIAGVTPTEKSHSPSAGAEIDTQSKKPQGDISSAPRETNETPIQTNAGESR